MYGIDRDDYAGMAMAEIWWPIGPPPASVRRRWLKKRSSFARVSVPAVSTEREAGGSEAGGAIAGQVELPAVRPRRPGGEDAGHRRASRASTASRRSGPTS